MTLLQNYLKTRKVQKALTTKPGEEGFSLIELVVVIAVLAILSAVAIPAFVGVQANAEASAVKNGLVNGVKECVVRRADNKTTTFTTAQSYANATAYTGYEIKQLPAGTDSGQGNSCFSAWADATNGGSDFTISLNASTGVTVKTCSDDTKPGCNDAAGTQTAGW